MNQDLQQSLLGSTGVLCCNIVTPTFVIIVVSHPIAWMQSEALSPSTFYRRLRLWWVHFCAERLQRRCRLASSGVNCAEINSSKCTVVQTGGFRLAVDLEYWNSAA
jgi:hypothetical protein